MNAIYIEGYTSVFVHSKKKPTHYDVDGVTRHMHP